MEISLSRAGCRSLSFALGVMAVARDFHRIASVLAVLAAVLLSFFDLTLARRMGAHSFSFVGHKKPPALIGAIGVPVR